MGFRWTEEEDSFLKFLRHAGQSINEISHDLFKRHKVRRSYRAITQRLAILKKKQNNIKDTTS
jgi:hypothetical protein